MLDHENAGLAGGILLLAYLQPDMLLLPVIVFAILDLLAPVAYIGVDDVFFETSDPDNGWLTLGILLLASKFCEGYPR